MTIAPLKSDIVLQLKKNAPPQKGASRDTSYRYPKKFKSLVLQALKQNVTVNEISEITGLSRPTLNAWRRRIRTDDRPILRKLDVVDSLAESPCKAILVKIGCKVTLEIHPDDLTPQLLAKLAEI